MLCDLQKQQNLQWLAQGMTSEKHELNLMEFDCVLFGENKETKATDMQAQQGPRLQYDKIPATNGGSVHLHVVTFRKKVRDLQSSDL
jgi:hypothetical protein